MKEGMIEVEIKVPLSNYDTDQLREAILNLGGEYLTSETQCDTYFDHPCRSFQQTDEAVRVSIR